MHVKDCAPISITEKNICKATILLKMTAAPWDYKLSMFEEKNVFRITWGRT